ncbi:MAG: glutamine synthetase III [Oscillospiraceae bacterium]|nr:glutamine synthetase III [Oscillospiraceae bacterium]
MNDNTNLFGELVFNDAVMKARLPEDVYTALAETILEGKQLSLDIADTVAAAMKDWAVEKGATHYTHWFQPMTGATAEKHDSFIAPKSGHGSKAILAFSGKSLIQGEPDASSFPTGGIRATFEARGYTVWDTTSYAFIKDGSLCIPTAFCAYTGESLDTKTPLLRSMEAINKQALRILRLFGDSTTTRVVAEAGAEQEYFLIDEKLWKRRPDLVFSGRTLFGASPPKGQELDDHYFGSIKPRVSAFMKELDTELWRLGIYAHTKHNEVAPGQHELAPIYTTANIATDQNQLTMEMMKTVARRHNMVCLLHEKPFAGVNGSGKHNNWSISTDRGENLLKPGKTPHENARFLLFLVAVIKAADEYQDLLRVCAASAGNDHRLGASEAPPAIMSVYLGEDLTAILEDNIQAKERENVEIGVTALPNFPKDTSDRNRTSPFAFTGNKFEFRMPGSSFSIAGPNLVINMIVAESLRQFADALEQAEHFENALPALIAATYEKHKRIIWSGDNYSPEWVQEAQRRGLSDLPSTVAALEKLTVAENIALYERHGILTETEVLSRYEIRLEGYVKTINIEALTMLDMAKGGLLPACVDYQNDLAKLLSRKRNLGGFDTSAEEQLLDKIAKLSGKLLLRLGLLESILDDAAARKAQTAHSLAVFYRDNVLAAMNALRKTADELEPLVAKKHRAYPDYAELLYSVI